jgi:response regulator RpfG family c-di-GMP phosphodiesterase
MQTPPAAEQPVMVLLVDDQAIVAEAMRRALGTRRHRLPLLRARRRGHASRRQPRGRP